ncbi:MAG: CPBP family intramembrane metalloprotease [Solobacterium sp.]|nr:CPBP family intramembrane metalloprotease [Solobacterium sp.]
MNNKTKELLRTILVVIITLGAYKLVGFILGKLMNNDNLESIIAQCIFSIFVLIAVAVLRRWSLFKTQKGILIKNWYVAWFIFLQITLTLLTRIDNFLTISIPAHEILYFLLQMILVGFCEEVLFRGLLQNAFHKYFNEDSWFHIILAILLSGLMFGAAHLTNAFSREVAFQTAAIQATATAMMGIYFGTIYYRTGKHIWYLIFLHAFYDTMVSIGNGRLSGKTTYDIINAAREVNPSSLLVIGVILIGISAILLRPKKIQPWILQGK